MGGFWTPPIKLLDGVWFRLDDQWLGDAGRRGGHQDDRRLRLHPHGFAPVDQVTRRADRLRAGRHPRHPGRADAHSPTAAHGAARRGRALRADGVLPVGLDHAERRHLQPAGHRRLSPTARCCSASRARRRSPTRARTTTPPSSAGTAPPRSHQLGPDHRGPQDPAVVCPADGPAPATCDDGAFGKGTGGQLTQAASSSAPDKPTTVWFAVAGSDQGSGRARASSRRRWPTRPRRSQSKVAARAAVGREHPGRPARRPAAAAERRVEQAEPRRLRAGGPRPAAARRRRGPGVPAPRRHARPGPLAGRRLARLPVAVRHRRRVHRVRRVAAGQFADIKAHLRALRDVSDVLNGDSGKVVHEVTPDGSVYFGSHNAAGNTDETAKFPSAVALVWRWTGDDAFRDEMYDFTVAQHALRRRAARRRRRRLARGPRQRRARRHGRGEARQHRLHDPRPARPRRPGRAARATRDRRPGPPSAPRRSRRRSSSAWWYGGDTDQYADSIDDPANPANDNTKIFQRHWIGVTPMEAELVRDGQVTRPLATDEHGHDGARAAQRALLHGRVRAVPHRHRPDLAPRTATRARPATPSVSTVQSERARLLAQHRDHGGGRGQLRPAGRGPAAALHDRQRPHPARPGRVGDAGRDARDRARARTSRPTSTGRSTTGRWRCRRGARTASCGRSCTTSSASAPTSAAAGSRSCRRSRTARAGRRQQHPARRRLGRRHGGAHAARR